MRRQVGKEETNGRERKRAELAGSRSTRNPADFQSAGIARFMGGVVPLPSPNANLPAGPSGASATSSSIGGEFRVAEISDREERTKNTRLAFYRVASGIASRFFAHSTKDYWDIDGKG